MTTVLIKNTDPCWVVYTFEVTVPDGLSDDEAKTFALNAVWGDEALETRIKVSDPDVRGQIEGMDQEFEATEVVR
jgi:hypothetical protein